HHPRHYYSSTLRPPPPPTYPLFPYTTLFRSRQLATNLMIDAKRVRHDHLQGIGSQSYGSLVRQHVKGLPAVAVLGSGKLAREILDRKSARLNSSHLGISYAVFCLKKKKKINT